MSQQATREIFSSPVTGILLGFWERSSVTNALLPIIEKWRKSLDEVVAIEAVPTDISKAFDCFPHEFLIAKFHGLVVDIPFLELLHL